MLQLDFFFYTGVYLLHVQNGKILGFSVAVWKVVGFVIALKTQISNGHVGKEGEWRIAPLNRDFVKLNFRSFSYFYNGGGLKPSRTPAVRPMYPTLSLLCAKTN